MCFQRDYRLRTFRGFLGLDEQGGDDAIIDPIAAFDAIWKTTARDDRDLLTDVANCNINNSLLR